MTRAAVVLPAKNEASTIAGVIRGIQAELERARYSATIVVVDDSTDGTSAIAGALGAVVIPGGGKGLGYAMYKGLKHSLRYGPEVVISLDSDGQTDVSELPAFLEPIRAGSADLVLGSRFRSGGLIDYPYSLLNRIGVGVLALFLRRITGLPITDSHGGIRAMRVEVAEALELVGSHTYVQESIIDAHEKGFRIVEIPSRWLPRKSGSSRVVGSIPLYVLRTAPALLTRTRQHLAWRWRH